MRFVKLNENGIRVAQELINGAERYGCGVSVLEGGPTLIDCGIDATGSLTAGCKLAEICLAGYGAVQLTAGDSGVWRGPWVTTTTDHPVAACMASQYAGWPVNDEDYFAMGSGPMRAARGREPVFEKIGFLEQPSRVVGVLECGKLPPAAVCADIARQCRVEPEHITLLLARTASLAGTIQIVARSLETTLHKMLELDFDLSRVVAGTGTAPLPPVAGDDLTGIGRTNDAVLYGGRVTIWVRGDDASLEHVGPRVPSGASKDYGQPFAEIFEHYDRDFYRIDPLLFSPSEVQFMNIDSGRWYQFGQPDSQVLQRSFTGAGK